MSLRERRRRRAYETAATSTSPDTVQATLAETAAATDLVRAAVARAARRGDRATTRHAITTLTTLAADIDAGTT